MKSHAEQISSVQQFEQVTGSGTSLVDFFATWCGPCRQLTPVVNQLAQQYEGQADVVKVNVDELPGLASQYGINSIPTLIVFQDGEEVDRFVGVAPAAQLSAAIDRAAKIHA